jgi:hypothetical protein
VLRLETGTAEANPSIYNLAHLKNKDDVLTVRLTGRRCAIAEQVDGLYEPSSSIEKRNVIVASVAIPGLSPSSR